MNSCTCGSIISFEGEINRFFDNDLIFCYKLGLGLLHTFHFFLTTSWCPKPNCLTPGLGAPILYNCSFNGLMNSRSCLSILSFKGKIRMEANNLVNFIPKRGYPQLPVTKRMLYQLSHSASNLPYSLGGDVV